MPSKAEVHCIGATLERIGFTLTLQSEYPTATQQERTDGTRHWRCTSIAAGPASASSKAKGVIQRQGDDFPLDTLPICDTCGANIGDHREAEPQRYRIARQRHLDRLLCQRRRSGVQRDCSIRHFAANGKNKCQ
jgi:hypothetical protein